MSRTRVTDSRTDSAFKSLCTTPSGQPISPPYNSPISYVRSKSLGRLKSITDDVHPNYHRRVNLGEVIMGGLALSTTERTMVEGSASGYIPEWEETWKHYGDLIWSVEPAADARLFDPAATYQANMTNLALVKAYVKMNQSSMMSGETLSELDKTIGMLRRPFRRSGEMLDKIQARKLRHLKKSASNLTEAISNAWLELRYGMQPIYLDYQTIVNECHKVRDTGRQERLVARASESGSWTTKDSFTDLAGGSALYTGSSTRFSTVEASAGVVYDVAFRTSSDQLGKIAGLRPRDNVLLIWEKLRFSFVFDWFMAAGDWLQAITPDPFVTVTGSWTTTKQTQDISVSASYKRSIGSAFITGPAGSSHRTVDWVNRVPNPSLPNLPPMTLQPLSGLHQADAMALVIPTLMSKISRIKSSN